MTAPAVLGLDLSLTATGIAVADGTLHTIKPRSEGDRRLYEIAAEISMLLAGPGPDLVVVEDLAQAGPRHAAANQLGMVHGAVRTALIAGEIPYLAVPPSSLKQYALGKGGGLGTGKPDMRMALYKRASLDIADDNQVDAWWLRAIGLDLLGHPELELPQTHRRALAKLHRATRCPSCGHVTVSRDRPGVCPRCRCDIPVAA